MELPQIRPGSVHEGEAATQVVAFFFNSAIGNSVIQMLTAYGIRNDQLGVTPPERIETGQGMVLSIPCPTEELVRKVEALCRSQGGQIHRASR
jgi:hypothetical protein